MDRKQMIEAAAARAASCQDARRRTMVDSLPDGTPVGRWVTLAIVCGQGTRTITQRGEAKRFRRIRNKQSTWAVLYPGQPRRGDAVRVRSRDGKVHALYVQSVVVPAAERSDRQSVLSVAKHPPHAEVERKEAAPLPKPPPMVKQRNPRICEECEGPCRPGAGVCDGCKRAMRGARVAQDGVMLKAGPEPEDVF